MTMLKIAVARVLKRYGFTIVVVLAANAFLQVWRDHRLSLLGLAVGLLAILACLALMALPVELHRLRAEASGSTVTPR